ncbi:beta-lactamase regulating signal transducer with metallopeptidase domain [Sphingomonas insulae]|uniref:Peptidase M56 domain-containing protein n=1 Tax=Sphingomonas insulae TaxID=424800 RepID=A0ABN1HXG9_9SPHN|nr:M56 family metallopeptidase [Sphingomonas insulae]NIJ29827.1 beta-lactamase regulating signal transducer with metallopeptidase domain [Sphingomonas insulae]
MTAWLIETLIASTVLMLTVLLARGRVRDAFGPQVAYALWALPALRLALPPLPDAWRQAAITPLSGVGETITILVVDSRADTATMGAGSLPSVAMVVAGLWAAGALGFLLWHLTSHTRFCRRLLGSAAAIEQVRGVHVIASDAATGPLAFGVLRRYVAFPLDFADRYDADERELALAHEIGHHQRGDLIANWIALAVLAVHWFNPIAWRAFRAFRADQELANDARVLAGRSTIDRHAYACAIVKAAHGGAVSAACHLHTVDDLKGRIRMLSTSKHSRRRLATGGVIVSTLVLAGLGLTASGTSAAAALSGKVGNTLGVDLQTVPQAPSVPTAPPAPGKVMVPQPPEAPQPPLADKPIKRVVVNRIGKDGNVSTYTSAPDGSFDDKGIQQMVDRSMKMVPEVTERNCSTGKDGGPKDVVVNAARGEKRMIVICANRIEAMVTAGNAAAINVEQIRRNAMQTALASVQASRADIAGNRSMNDADRKEALAEMDQALAELRTKMTSPDKD